MHGNDESPYFRYLGSGSKRFLTVSNGQKRFLGLRLVNKTLVRSGSESDPQHSLEPSLTLCFLI